MSLLRRAVEALERMADGVAAVAAALQQLEVVDPGPVGTADGACPHPADERIDFGVTAGQPDWQCRRCGYRSTEDATHG